MAIIHIAMFEAFNAIHGGFTSLNTAINWVEDTF